MITNDTIKSIVDNIVRYYDPEKVILFGSYASGAAKDDSDLDILVVKETELPRIKRAREIRKHLVDYFVAKDILVYTRKEIDEWKNVRNAFITTVMREGRVLYEKH
jgi:predicted nucleotidyltransferase